MVGGFQTLYISLVTNAFYSKNIPTSELIRKKLLLPCKTFEITSHWFSIEKYFCIFLNWWRWTKKLNLCFRITFSLLLQFSGFYDLNIKYDVFLYWRNRVTDPDINKHFHFTYVLEVKQFGFIHFWWKRLMNEWTNQFIFIFFPSCNDGVRMFAVEASRFNPRSPCPWLETSVDFSLLILPATLAVSLRSGFTSETNR